MSDDLNDLYKAPEADLGSGVSHSDAWFDGSTLVIPKGGTVPTDRCIRCCQPAKRMYAKTLTWYHPALALLILLNILIFIIVALIVQKKGRLSFSLCAECLAKRKKALFMWLGGMLAAAVASGFVFSMPDNEGLGIVLVLVALVCAIFAAISQKLLTIEKITPVEIRLKKVPADFLGASPWS